jgi:ATP-binding cassette subfamily B protein
VILAMAQEAMTAAARARDLRHQAGRRLRAGEIEAPRGHLRFEHVDFGFPTPTTLTARRSWSFAT